MRFLASETEDEDRNISGYVGRHFSGSAQALEAGVWPARGWQSKELQDQGRLTMAWVPIMGGITVFSVEFTTRRTGHSATNRYWRRQAEKFGGARVYGFWRAISTWSHLGAIRHTRETARGFGQASSTHLQAWSVSPMLRLLCGPPRSGMQDSGSARVGGFWHQPSSLGPDESEDRSRRCRRPQNVATTHRWLCARTSLLGLRSVGEHGRTMDAAHAEH